MKICENGIWEGADVGHFYDSKLASNLVAFFKKVNASSVVDLGCGKGDYVKYLNDNSIKTDGFDGNPDTPKITNNTCGIKDLSKHFKFDNPYDWVMSLEVGEHLPKEFEDTFIKNLHYNNKSGIVLSWAVKGQGGQGHFNEQNNDYVKEQICKLGYINDIESENELRKDVQLWWFKNTLMVFKSENKQNYTHDLTRHLTDNLRTMIPNPVNEQMLCIEIGSFEGRGSIVINDYLCNHKESKLLCIDPFDNEYVKGNEKTAFWNDACKGQLERFRMNTKNYPKIIEMKGTSDDLIPTIKDNSVDFVYIDGDHTPEQVYKDAVNIFDKMKKNSYILFDDYGFNTPLFRTSDGIDKFLEEYKDKYELLLKNWQLGIKKL